MITVTAFILATAAACALAFIFGFITGSFVTDAYKGKRICRECMRGFAKHGFHVDGAEYVCTKREG